MDEYTEDYRNGFVDRVAGAIAVIFEECDEEMLPAVFQKLNIMKCSLKSESDRKQ